MNAEPHRRILLVEDEADIRDSLKALLEMSIPGVDVALAATGAQGLSVLNSHRADLIITDYRMPGMNGLDFLAAARALSPETPRIMMTAYPDLDVATRAINEAHIQSFLPKPLEPDDIIAKVVRAFQAAESKVEEERALARNLYALSKAMGTSGR